MRHNGAPGSVDEAIRALRIVVGGLMGGLLSFTVLASIVGPVSRSPDLDLAPWMLIAVAVFGGGCAAAYAMFRRSLLRSLSARAAELRQQSDPSRLIVEQYRRFVVAGGGLIEGPGFFAAVTYLVTGNPLALGAAGLAVALLAAHFPSAGALRRLAEAAAREYS